MASSIRGFRGTRSSIKTPCKAIRRQSDIGALIIRQGLGAYYTIIIRRNPQQNVGNK